MRFRRYLYPILGVSVIMATLLVVRWILFSTVTITFTGEFSPTYTQVLVDNKRALPSGEGGRTFKLRAWMGSGERKVDIKAAGYNDFSTNITVSLRSTETVSIELTARAPEEIAKEIYTPKQGLIMYDARYFGSRNWLIFKINDAAKQKDGALLVAKYVADKSSWEVIDEGAGSFDTTKEVYADAPPELVRFIGGF